MTALTETYDRIWSPVIETLRADALDCVQANLAALADRHRGPGAHLELGATLRFETEAGADGTPRVAASVPHRLAAARDLLGLRVVRRWDGVDGAQLGRLRAEHGPLYVVADAYHLGWTPYAGRRHAEHTFVLSSSDTVVDAYHDETPWGSCRPGVWRLPAADLAALIPTGTAFLITAEPVATPSGVIAANARSMAAAGPAIAAYLGADRADLDGLLLDIWLLGRSRLLHAAWLARHGGPDAGVEVHARDWLTLASKSFVAARRSRGTGRPPGTLLAELDRLLRADLTITARLLAQREPVRATVLDVIGSVLRIDENTVLAADSLRDLPGYNSFRLVEIINEAEGRLGVELGEDDLTAQAINDVDGLGAVFARRAGGTAR